MPDSERKNSDMYSEEKKASSTSASEVVTRRRRRKPTAEDKAKILAAMDKAGPRKPGKVTNARFQAWKAAREELGIRGRGRGRGMLKNNPMAEIAGERNKGQRGEQMRNDPGNKVSIGDRLPTAPLYGESKSAESFKNTGRVAIPRPPTAPVPLTPAATTFSSLATLKKSPLRRK